MRSSGRADAITRTRATAGKSTVRWGAAMCLLMPLLKWPMRRWLTAILASLATFAAMGLSTAVIPSPFFGRTIPPTSWSMGVLLVTSILAGLLMATYVRITGPSRLPVGANDRPARGGMIGGALSFFAIGCPVCNKLVLLALGATGAVKFFAPVQPYLATAGMLLLGWALLVRLRGEMACAYVAREISAPEGASEPAGASEVVAGSVGDEGGSEHLDPLAADQVSRPAG